MMTQVDFYITSFANKTECLNYCCRLIEKAYNNKRLIFIECPTQELAHNLDELLWTFQKESFIPHHLIGEGPTPPPPVQIGYSNTPPSHQDVFINLCAEIPSFYNHFQRICEIIPNQEEERSIARTHYRFYREQGYKIETHHL